VKAIQVPRLGPADVLQLVDLPLPEPGPGQVLVEVAAASVNYIDVLLRQGAYPVSRELPYIPGVECSGTVESVAPEVTSVRPGQKVAVIGKHDFLKCYAEYVVVDAEDITPLPDGVDMDDAAAMPVIYLTAHFMLNAMAHARKGQTVLIHAAAGGVGTAAIQLGKLAGLKLIGLTSSDEKAQFALEQGCDHVINYKSEDVAARVQQITGGEGVDLSLNSVAGSTFGRDFEMLAPLGQVIWYGAAGGLPTENLAELVGAGFGQSKGIRTFVIYSLANRDPTLYARGKQEMVALLAATKISPPIHERLPLSEAKRAHTLLESGAVKGKLILRP